MWNLSGAEPARIEAKVLTRVPDALRKPVRTAWVDANMPGRVMDSFLEGPTFDRDGNLFLVDIPHGRIFKVTPALQWSVAAEYDGWPNGLALNADGSLWIADYRRGILRLAPGAAMPEAVLTHRNSESFRGVNDLVFDRAGNLYFTDQGQSGLHDPSGRVYRLRPTGELNVLLDRVPSPNGLALTADESVLFVAVTRANQVWRCPLLPDGSMSKVGAFRTFYGVSGPDGLAITPKGELIVAHASLGAAFVLTPRGDVSHVLSSSGGAMMTNVALRPNTYNNAHNNARSIVTTESDTGNVLECVLP